MSHPAGEPAGVIQVGHKPLVMVTGATGFVGTILCRTLEESGYRVRRAVRVAAQANDVAVGDIDCRTRWADALVGVGSIIHLAARTHVLRDTVSDPLAEYRRINVRGTERLAHEALQAGVGRVIFMSSVKVNGEATSQHPFVETNAPQPQDAYGLSKWEAEQALWNITAGTHTAGVVLRPPLIYGPGVKGNILRLMHLVARHCPLPLASIENRRSLVYVGTLVSAVIACLKSDVARGRTYLVSDGPDLSTPQLVRSMAAALEVRAFLLPCPVPALRLAAAITGQSSAFQRIAGSLQVSSSSIRTELDWESPFTPQQGMKSTAQWYYASARGRSRTLQK